MSSARKSLSRSSNSVANRVCKCPRKVTRRSSVSSSFFISVSLALVAPEVHRAGILAGINDGFPDGARPREFIEQRLAVAPANGPLQRGQVFRKSAQTLQHGILVVEREGISIKHPARFVLVGSGNPEEGELRPQLLDRFGMHAEIRTVRDPETRVRVVEERSTFDKDPEECIKANIDKLEALKQDIKEAQELLPNIEIDYDLRIKISQVCGSLDVDGLRGDIVTNRAAKAYAAYNKQSKVTVTDIEKVITLCLRHRLRKDPLESIDGGSKVSLIFEEVFK